MNEQIEARLFQQQSLQSDQAVAIMLASIQERGIPPAAICAGALFAVVRYHIDHASVPASERAIMKMMLPALSKTVRELIATADQQRLEAEAVERQRMD